MKHFLLAFLLVCIAAATLNANETAKKIYETEKAFEKAVAEKGINEGFIQFLAPLGVMFVPEPANGREFWRSIPPSQTWLTWDPVWIDVSSNATLAYSVGNSARRANGKDDPNVTYGHYLSVWSRQADGEYRAVLDAGVSHPKPDSMPKAWKSPEDIAGEKNEKRLSAADSSVSFYEMVDNVGSIKAYKKYLAADAILLREGMQPLFGKKAAVDHLERSKPRIRFAKRKGFVEAPDIAYVYNTYELVDRSGARIERGSFAQVWKLRKGEWLIAAEILSPAPPAKN